jgi:hypothetical protein
LISRNVAILLMKFCLPIFELKSLRFMLILIVAITLEVWVILRTQSPAPVTINLIVLLLGK